MRTLATVLFIALSVSPSRAAQEQDHLHIDEISETFLRQWAAAEESRNAKELLDLYTVAHDTLSRKLARPEPEVDRWIPLERVLAAKLAALPGAALESHEIIARQVLEAVLEPAERRRAIEKYAYTKAGRDALDQLSNIECDRGRMTEALKGWSRALEVRPGVETVARLAFAHAMRKDGVSLASLRAQAETRSIKGEITVEGRKRELYEYLDSLGPARPLRPAGGRPLRRAAGRLAAGGRPRGQQGPDRLQQRPPDHRDRCRPRGGRDHRRRRRVALAAEGSGADLDAGELQ